MSARGWIRGGENPELPFTDETTSRDAAERMAPTAKGLRLRVLKRLYHGGDYGVTDEEGFTYLGMRQTTYVARRNELMNATPPLCYKSNERRVSMSGVMIRVFKITETGRMNPLL